MYHNHVCYIIVYCPICSVYHLMSFYNVSLLGRAPLGTAAETGPSRRSPARRAAAKYEDTSG